MSDTKGETKGNEAVCKMMLDLWVHQNTLMWSRLQVLSIVQVVFLSLSTFLSTPSPSRALHEQEFQALPGYTMLLCTLATFALMCVMLGDKALRDAFRAQIEDQNLGIFPASLDRNPMPADKTALVGESIVYVVLFGIVMSLDLYASYIFGVPPMLLRVSELLVAIALSLTFFQVFRLRAPASLFRPGAGVSLPG
jgi:hypothetical protein